MPITVLIVLGTTTPDLIFPSSACLLQHKLGANGCPAFDVNAACSGFIYALTIADKFIQSGAAKTALVVGSETLTRMLDWSDRGTCVLFGDGAGAVVLKADGETGILSTHMHADGGKKELLWNPVGVSVGFKPDEKNAGVRVLMTGNEVFKHAVKALDSVVEEALLANGLDRHELDWLVPHQANLRIIEATAKRLEMPMERVIVTVDRHGNTSSGSVPLALDEAVRAGKIQRGQLVGLSLFAWTAEILFPWRKDQPRIRQDFWLDGFYMFFNYFLFSLIAYNAVSNVAVDLFNSALAGIGITNIVAIQGGAWPRWAQLLTLFLVADFIHWNVHRMLHRVPWMWKFHQVHHSVKQMGFAAHLRFHWMENVFYKSAQYIPLAMIGFGLEDFFIVHIFATAIGHLNHSNLNLSYGPLKYVLNNATVMEKYMHTVHLRDSFNISWSNEYPKKLKSVPAEMAAIRIFNSSHPTNTQ